MTNIEGKNKSADNLFKKLFSCLFYFFLNPFILIRKHLDLLIKTTCSDIKHIYAGSIFGLLWVFLGPFLLLSIYAIVYSFILKIRPPDLTTGSYILFLFCGLVPFLGFSSALMQGTTALTQNKQLLLNTIFPSEFLVLKVVISNSLVLFVGVGIILIMSFFIVESSLVFLYIPIVVILQTLFVAGLSWIMSLFNLVTKDVQQFLSYFIILLMISSPIAYTPSMIPSSMLFLIYINPFSYYVISFQQLIVFGVMPDLWIILVCFMQSILMFCFGFLIFNYTKKVFYDFA